MAGALVGATAGFFANKVAILVELDEKLKAMAGTKRKIEKFKELLTNTDSVIQNVESRPSINPDVKELLKKLKYLAYDLEDVVDYYDTKVLQKKQRSNTALRPVRDFFSPNNQVVFKSRIGSMIKAITESLESILLQKSILLNLPPGMSQPSPYRENHSRNRFVVKGREPEKQMIVNMLIDDDESSHDTVKVIAIVGMGGLGKTTLAQLVYNDQRVQDHFASPTMWTVVGAEFDPANIMKSVLELTTEATVNISEIDLVRQKLEKALSGKRFLLVLDDVWNEDQEKWDVLKATLICGAKGSKILVTTRSQNVSSIMGSSNTTTHQIQQLSKDDCLSLFQQFAFGDNEADDHQNLMEIGGKIVEKCGGVPLAAKSLGSMLRGTRDETYWSSVLKSEIWQLRDEEQKVLAVLKLSYDVLSPQSKKCFTFGSLFPKDYPMRKDELIKLWIANDFVRSEGNFDAETNGNHIFDDLVRRSFFLLDLFEDDPNVANITMHDLMHDLARSESAYAYWNSYQDSVEVIQKRAYHLQVVEGKLPDMTQVFGKKPLYLRTFMSLMPRYSSSLSINLLEVFSKLKYLRALDLTGCGIRKISASIENLIHLRYLNLYYNTIEVLPDSITYLSNLQYLNLGFNHELRELPKELGNMQNLRELDLVMDNRLIHIPCGLSRLTNLRSLPVFIASDKTGACSIRELEDLKLQGEMIIKFSDDFKNYSCSGRKILKNKVLNKLLIEFNGSGSYHKDMLDDLSPNTTLKKLHISNYTSPQFPTWMKELQLPNLVEVHLHCSCGHIPPPFRNLQSLKRLTFSMHGITHLGAEFHGSGGFPSLQELKLSRMDDLQEWSESHVDDQLFPSLRWLHIFRCPNLKSTPRLPTLRHLEILCCSQSILSCIGRLTSLSFLRVHSIYGVTSLPSGCIRNLTSLTELQIISCRQLQSLPGDEMQYLQMLRSLTIEGCINLASFPSEVGSLTSLCRLQLSQCPSIILQPEEFVRILNSVDEFQIQICGDNVNLCGRLQYLRMLEKLSLYGARYRAPLTWYTNQYKKSQLRICCCNELESLMTAEPANNIVLEELYICGIYNLKTLPDWLQHLKFLRLLSVENCPLLETVPRGLKNLHMLETLKIANCPLLESRCERETGVDWPIISHVRNVYVRSSAGHGEEVEDEDWADMKTEQMKTRHEIIVASYEIL
ncbi:putative disease resistance protein RGA3 isoform X1 [Zingiber officinale]|nr:putative disease resistance protein RGA3 isoform X1 [Zingiber officinale]